MSRKSGREMRKLILAVTVSTLILVLAVIAYFMVDIFISTGNNIEHNKERMVEESVRYLNDASELASMTNVDPSLYELFNQEMVRKAMLGDIETLYNMVVKVAISIYPLDYVGVVSDGKVTLFASKGGEEIDTEKMPVQPPEGEYEILDRLGDRKGFFVSVFAPVDLSIVGLKGTMYVNVIVDRTAELAAIDDYFTSQRNSLVLRLSVAAIIAIILSILLTTLGLRFFTEKYVVKPVEKLNRAAEAIMDGTFEGEAEYDEKSSFAALQALLRSGQRVLSKMDKQMRE